VFIYNKLFNECDVHAYVDKQLGFKHVVKAINIIIRGGKYVDPNIVAMIEVGEKMKISKREKEVMPYLMEGFTQKEIGEKLFISKKTIEKHVENTAKKFGVKKTVPLIVKYLKHMFSNRENSEGGFTPFD
jgi:DNA-binding NarL/FixJ family response regulator